jgi:hypothetical protein
MKILNKLLWLNLFGLKLIFVFYFIVIAIRFFHLSGPIDLPHDWRQLDTFYYIWDFYQNGIDLLHPTVSWMGNHPIVLLEFPLPEAIIAFFFQLFGESLLMARIIFFLAFLGAAIYYYKIVCLISHLHLARLSTLAYLIMPLGFFYSRAIHIDFFVLLCVHAMFYYFILGVRNRSWFWMILSVLFAGIGILVKSPYFIMLIGPMIYIVHKNKAWLWILKTGFLFLIPIVLLFFWQQHMYHMNNNSPDWDYILHYRKMTNNWGWYFGSLRQRLYWYNWYILFKRGVLEVSGIGGILFFMLGSTKLFNKENLIWLLWVIGLIFYVLLFFNLNVTHNYYQLPLMAPAAFLMAKGWDSLNLYGSKYLLLGIGASTMLNIIWSETAYYKINSEEIKVAHLVEENTIPGDLPIITYNGIDCKNPKILARAKRKGWSIEEDALNPEVLRRLSQEEGARVWFYVSKSGNPPNIDYPLTKPIVHSLDEVCKLFIYIL